MTYTINMHLINPLVYAVVKKKDHLIIYNIDFNSQCEIYVLS